MLRFLIFALFFCFAFLSTTYLLIFKNFGASAIDINFFIYLLQKGQFSSILRASLNLTFPFALLLYIISAFNKEKAVRLYCFVLIALSMFFISSETISLIERFVKGNNLAWNYKFGEFIPPKKAAYDKAKEEKNSESIEKNAEPKTLSVKTTEATPTIKTDLDTYMGKDFFSKNYVPAKPEIIKAPEHKKNILLVFMESMEQTFANGKLCGANLIPFLSDTAKDNISFANYKDGYATNWTQAALVAATTGLPSAYLSLQETKNKDVNKVSEEVKTWLNGIYSLGEILKDNGYNRLFVQGGNLSFSGTGNFLSSHGFKNMAFGAEELKHYGKKQTSWGIADKDIYEIFEDKLSKLSKDKPFFAILTTIDTHHYNVPKDTPKFFDIRSKDVIHQADTLIKDFLNRFYVQPYAADTLVIIIGDHLRMSGGLRSGSGFLKTIPKSKRKIYNVFINSVQSESPLNLQRTFTQIDLFPTILEAAGFTIKGHRLGLGTSIFSDEKTLIERYEADNLSKKLREASPLYNHLWE